MGAEEKGCWTSPFNAYYGHETILQEFCDVPYDLPVHGQIQHGWIPPGYPTIREHDPLLCVGHLWSELDIRENQPRFTIVGAPYLYLLDAKSKSSCVSAGLLAIPSHGIRLSPLLSPWDEYAGWLAEESKRRNVEPVTVCLSPFDYANGYEAFALRRIRVVSASPRGISVPGFLYRIRSFIRQHAFVTTNRIGTPAFYAAYEGRGVTIEGPLMTTDPPDGGEELTGERNFLSEHFDGFLPGSIDIAAQRRYAEQALGVRHKKTPSELRSLLWGWYFGQKG